MNQNCLKDFTYTRAYMSQMFKFDDCYIAHKVGKFLMAKIAS